MVLVSSPSSTNEKWDWYLPPATLYAVWEMYTADINSKCDEDCIEYVQSGEAIYGSQKVLRHPGHCITS